MITKDYIKMCEADNDLKWDDKSWKPKYGDYRPTQEELQDVMIPFLKKKFRDFWDMKRINIWMIQHFINFMHDIKYLDSLNEFWFAFVAKEKYNKTWTGKDWV